MSLVDILLCARKNANSNPALNSLTGVIPTELGRLTLVHQMCAHRMQRTSSRAARACAPHPVRARVPTIADVAPDMSLPRSRGVHDRFFHTNQLVGTIPAQVEALKDTYALTTN